jgi:spore maturation protein CgeB
MKLFKVTTFYPSYIQKFFNENPNVAEKSYKDQKTAFEADQFAWSNFWSQALGPLGYEVEEVTANVESMQRRWLTENGLRCNSRNWILEITALQIIHFKPEILFLDDYSTFTYSWIQEIRSRCPSIRLVIGWCGASYQDVSVFRAYDAVLSCVPEMVENFKRMGHTAFHINHAFSPSILEHFKKPVTKTIDLSFIGQVARGKTMHGSREQLLKFLAEKNLPLEIFSPLKEADAAREQFKYLAKIAAYYGVKSLKTFGVSNETLDKFPKLGGVARWEARPQHESVGILKNFLRPSVFGINFYQKLLESRVTLNSHIDISPRSASNMRLFEATGIGTCLLTDWKENIAELFVPEEEVVTYRSFEECAEKARWLLENPGEQKKIAEAGQKRCLKDHTFAQRAKILDEIIKSFFQDQLSRPSPKQYGGQS